MFHYRRPVFKDLIFLVAIAFGWVVWYYLVRREVFSFRVLSQFHLAFGTWAFLSGLLAVSFLYWIDFFRAFKSFKAVPDFIALIFILPITGIFAKPVVGFLFELEFLRSREIALGGFLPAACAICIEGLLWWARGKSTVKSTVYLALTEGEHEQFLESLKVGGWEKYYRVLSQSDFNGALATGGRVDHIVISRIGTKNFIQHQNILQAQMLGVQILDYRTLLSQLRGHISLHDTDIWSFLAGSVRQNWVQAIYRGLKFYLEPVVAACLIVVLFPAFLVVSIAIKLSSPGPIFFRQRRTGYQGVPFELVKFRSMRTDAEASGAKWATKDDDRVTGIGKLLRKTRLDEIPQLWNVLRGEMSFIGPRPERPEFYEVIGRQVPLFRLRLLVRPGITGWAQLLGGYAASIEESERKLEFDLYYMQYLSPRMDLVILWRTILILFRGDSGR